MEHGRGDALARSQLALLYKLGVLEQDAGEEENDPHAFLNRLPPPAAPEAVGGDRDHRFSQRLQTSGEQVAGAFKDSKLSPYAPVRPYTPVIDVRIPRVEPGAARRPPTAVSHERSRAPLSPLSVAAAESRIASPATSRILARDDRRPIEDPWEIKATWFHAWKRRLESKSNAAKAETEGRAKTKSRIFMKWRDAVYKRRLQDARRRQLVVWKAKRALRTWTVWASLHGRVTWFLTAQGRAFTLMSRLRLQRTLRRWRAFVVWSGRNYKKKERAAQWHDDRARRRCWLEWRVLAFQARQRRKVYRVFLDELRREQERRHARWLLACDLYDSHAEERLKRLLRRWRLFNAARQCDHHRTWRIRMGLTRSKYFSIWQSALHHERRIDALRLRVARHVKRDHLLAWHTATQALVLGRSSTLWHPEAIRARYLYAWKRWTRDAVRFRVATSVVHARQLKKALGVMRAWTVDHVRLSRLRRSAVGITRRRVLVHVWENGLLAFHFKRQREKKQTQLVRAITEARVMKMWRLVWSVRHQWRQKGDAAGRMALRVAFHRFWLGWRRHTVWRRRHKGLLVDAARHHLQHLLMRGLVALSRIVDRKSAQTTAFRTIRAQQRGALRRRTLQAWREHVARTVQLDQILHCFLLRPGFAVSVWNPMRRVWLRWEAFTRVRRDVRLLRGDNIWRALRRVFLAWMRQASVVAVLHSHQLRRRMLQRRELLAVWRHRVAEWRRKSEARLAATRIYRQTYGSRVLQAWRSHVQVCRRVRRHGQTMAFHHDHNLFQAGFTAWRSRFLQRQRIRTLIHRRRVAWLTLCWDLWRESTSRGAKHKRKLRYYRQIYGAFPATSPLRRVWYRWKALVSLQSSVTQRRHRYQCRAVGNCFSGWKTFRLAKLALRNWHTVSVIAAATCSDRGKRCRLFRCKRLLRVLRNVFITWRNVARTRQREQESLAIGRRRILGEIRQAHAERGRQRRCRLRMWFQRWRRRQLGSLHCAVEWHRLNQKRRVLHAWWRQVVHAKQEQLLAEARKAMQMMSANALPKPHASRAVGPRNTRGHAKTETGKRVPPQRNQTSVRVAPVLGSARVVAVGRMVDPRPSSTGYLHHNFIPTPTFTDDARSTKRRAITMAGSSAEKITRGTEQFFQSNSPLEIPPRTLQTNRPTNVRSHDELPLFDDDTELVRDPYEGDAESRQPRMEEKDIRTWAEPAAVHSLPTVTSALHSASDEPDLVMSLEHLASMDMYSFEDQQEQTSTTPRPAPHPAHRHANLPPPTRHRRQLEQDGCVRQLQSPQPTLYSPRQSLRLPEHHSVPRKQQAAPKRAAADGQLTELLELTQEQQRQERSTFRAVLQGMGSRDEDTAREPDVDAVIRSITGYYVLRSQQLLTGAGSSSQILCLETSGFCMLRDLGLFENGYFVTALGKAISRLPTDCRGAPHDVLRGLLEEFVEKHPAYSSARDGSSERFDTLGWLVSIHLCRRHGRAAVLTHADCQQRRPFWIRCELPHDVVGSLPKLIKCFKKYQKPLEQFFVWRPEKSVKTGEKVMDRTAFMRLMKACNVHPQLFDRRELEEAVGSAGSRHDTTLSVASNEVTLSFPAFVEALVRCASRLKWVDEPSDLRDTKSANIVIVVKFLMLVFAMEGKGSMLTKRSQDLDVVMDFLRRQQGQSKTDKLRRFQGLLRAESASARGARRPRDGDTASAFQVAMRRERDEDYGTAPVRRRHGDEELRKEQRGQFVSHGGEVERVSHRSGAENYDAGGFHETDHQDRGNANLNRDSARLNTPSQRRQQETSNPEEMGIQRTRSDGPRSRLVGDDWGGPRRWDRGSTAAMSNSQDDQSISEIHASSRLHNQSLVGDCGGLADGTHGLITPVAENARDSSSGETIQSPPPPVSQHEVGLREPMDREAFLNDILSSIHDVELLLHHSETRRPSPGRTEGPDTAELDVELTSEPFSVAHPERYAVLMTGQLPPLADQDDTNASFPADDVHVGDPVLDYLTFADRFSESADWQSRLSIAEVAAHGIHAAFPSAMHVQGRLETSELDDLTDPQQTTTCLRTDNEDVDLHVQWE